ncbi:MAG: M3 family oligoendopeptidase [candidate division Zixibacteria bacterium]|nr:M3 family oligoendopeptidase [candidate division Zixibacteria bacterium]MDD5426524.1 M3 family oligoendopeptidase [candidate division Zixibacteria bacterium]
MTPATTLPPSPTWDLDSIFPGGSKSVEFKNFRLKVKKDLYDLAGLLDRLPVTLNDRSRSSWIDFVLKFQNLLSDIYTVMSFANCLVCQNVSDSEAHRINNEGDAYKAQWDTLYSRFEALALKQDENEWQKFITNEQVKEVSFYLNEMREKAKRKMLPELEALALELAVNGYHAWNHLYDKMAADIRVTFKEKDEVKTLSMGQLATRFSDPDRAVRQQAFEKLTEGWQSRVDLAAMILNAQAGFRLTLYKNRSWETPLYEPLTMARLQPKTLEAMWRVIARETPRLAPYIEAKKKILGIDRFRWYDEFSPCGKADKLYPFDEAGRFIIDNVKDFSEHMADFMKMALAKRWVEAEDRPGKAGGGWCTSLKSFKQSRIFMTYAGTFENMLTLAHELGHAYHGYILKDRPFFASRYTLPLAETASIFSETLVLDAALEMCTDPQEKIMLLDQKLQAAYTMFTNIHCRYLFDTEFYRERENGTVDKNRLNELMMTAQKKAFGSLLDESGYHPLFWCSKLHFFITDQPFYNFPYTFGYLFAGGVYDRAKKEGASFADKYRALLADTGSMTCEQVAQKHLGVDLTRDDFWVDAVNRALANVDQFAKLASHL